MKLVTFFSIKIDQKIISSKFWFSRLHRLNVKRKINYDFSHPQVVDVPVKLAIIQRLDGVVEIMETFDDDIAGSKLAAAFCFFEIWIILEWLKKDDPVIFSQN